MQTLIHVFYFKSGAGKWPKVRIVMVTMRTFGHLPAPFWHP